MAYLIDGNNVAGKLGMLDESDFDTKLVRMISEYCEEFEKEATIVFDSADILGDRFVEGPVTVIYTPRDAVYDNADDKIIEIMEGAESEGGQWILVTDDNDLLDSADELGIDSMLGREFMKKLLPPEEVDRMDDETELSGEAREEIADELMEEWNS